MTAVKKTSKAVGMWRSICSWCITRWNYASDGVWEDHRDILKVKAVKTANLTVRTFMSTDLQSKACAMTYRTMLAIVPALALLFAIGRGFGFQNMLQGELLKYFPSQHKALEMAFSFVDSCLAQASEGIFVGVGIVFLLWTLISLLDSVEESFNQVWGVTVDRSIFRKVTDYLAICIILPLLMICSGGLQIFMSNAIQTLLPFDIISPFIQVVLDCASYIFAWLFFAGAYMLIPNAKVKFINALIAGVIAGTAFQVLQWLFLSGQIYVAKYNAIYGSFSFLPLMLIWMQLSWLITLAGALICCAAQNITMFAYRRQTENISLDYRIKVTIALLAVILKRFRDNKPPVTIHELSERYFIPDRLTGRIIEYLLDCRLIVRVAEKGETEITTEMPVVPAMSIEHFTVRYVLDILLNHGEDNFIPEFDKQFKGIGNFCNKLSDNFDTIIGNTLLVDID